MGRGSRPPAPIVPGTGRGSCGPTRGRFARPRCLFRMGIPLRNIIAKEEPTPTGSIRDEAEGYDRRRAIADPDGLRPEAVDDSPPTPKGSSHGRSSDLWAEQDR